PILRFEQAHRPPGRRAPFRSMARLVPDLYSPKANLPGRERPPIVLNICRSIAGDLAAVPQSVAWFRAGLCVTRDEDLIGGLPPSPPPRVGCQQPGQPRMHFVNSNRVNQILATKLNWFQRILRGFRRRCAI